MKTYVATALKLLLSYLLIIVLGTLLGAVLYMIYSLCTTLVAGQGIASFEPVVFVRGIFLCAPIVMMASSLFMVIYLICHPSHSWLPLSVYAVLCFVTWLVFIPLVFSAWFSVSAGVEQAEDKKSVLLSPGYFRNEGKSLFFYTRVTEDNVADGVCITFDKSSGELSTFSSVELPYSERGFTDSLIRESVGMPRLVFVLTAGFTTVLHIAQTEYTKGYLSWLCFSSMALAFFAAAGLRHVSKWRLVSLIFVGYYSFGVIIFNGLCYSDFIVTSVQDAVNGILKNYIHVGNPFLVICNLLLAVIFAVIGLVLDVHRKAELKEKGAD